ncbi:hypothetical protein M2282_001916 [Variovorax boronicumulans]|uniref:hypothetical protein n=1 Tax=Variovorax boronicumulans TaxID=436515 RepID=UPI0024764E87|nr:hypothetical protein [Variovorax boronicumulans]MDH6166769.1 hypothetical protein [Variovorax boronicumulans]
MFFSRQPKPPASKLIQLHEYLDLLQEGTEDHAAGDAIKRGAVALAQSLREPLRLKDWAAPEPARVFARRAKAHDALLVHVPLDIRDCFFIAIFRNGASTAGEHLLFDIGAEYQTPMLDCPDFGVAEAANEANIRHWVPLLKDDASAFAVIELRGGTYMQVYADAKGFHLEHQLVTTGAHYHSAEPLSADAAIDTLVSYACGKYEWAYKRWEWLAL